MEEVPHNCSGLHWLGYNWSKWQPLNDVLNITVPAQPGLYRIRHEDRRNEGLEYLGESGDIARRINSLRRGTYADQMPFRDPHTAAPCTWAIRDAYGPNLEVSFATPADADDDQVRKSMEAALIASHRREVGQSPTANFGRIINGYQQSSYRRDGRRGGKVESIEEAPESIKGARPLNWTDSIDVCGSNWMGLKWSKTYSLGDRLDPDVPEVGLYRIWYEDTSPPLAYIGESSNVPSRLYKHERVFGGEALFSFVARPDLASAPQRQEIETSLIGAHHLQRGKPPLAQFGYQERLPKK